MDVMWLLHVVGESDLGVDSQDPIEERPRAETRARRLAALRSTTDPGRLGMLLRDLAWDGQKAGIVSPLGLAAAAVPPGRAVRLFLACTKEDEHTQGTADIAGAIRAALEVVPDAYGFRCADFDVVTSIGLTEQNMTDALFPVLSAAGSGAGQDTLVVWGSGSTSMVLGCLAALIEHDLPWEFVRVGPHGAPQEQCHRFDPLAGMTHDPLLTLLRRWYYHDLLDTPAGQTLLDRATEPLRTQLADECRRWRRARTGTTVEDLRLVMAAALARGDATGGFAVRRYVQAHYEEQRQRDGASVNVLKWAEARDRHAKLGAVIAMMRQPSGRLPGEVRRAARLPSGRWLCASGAALVKLGNRSAHALKPPHDEGRATLRAHLAEIDRRLVPARAVWYVTLAGRPPRAPSPDVLHEFETSGVDKPVARYLDLERVDVETRFLVLGTRSKTFDLATKIAERLAAAPTVAGAEADMVPDPDERFGPDEARMVLERHLRPVEDVGALVLIPTGAKPLLLPLLIAGQRLAMELGVPFFVREMSGDGMHLLPYRFGVDRVLFDLAAHALSTVELQPAKRLLAASSADQSLAGRVDALSAALRCSQPERRSQLEHSGQPEDSTDWPDELTGHDRAQRTVGLIAERIEVWADLARADPAQAQRAVIAAHACLEYSIKLGYPRARHENGWAAFCADRSRQMAKGRGVVRDAARTLAALSTLRNGMPLMHPNGPDDPAPGVAADLLDHAARAARCWPQFATVPAGRAPSLLALLTQLREEVDAMRSRVS